MASTGNMRVHGGYFDTDRITSGSHFHLAITGLDLNGHVATDGAGYTIVGAAGSNDFVVGEGKAVPDSAAEIVYRTIAKRATPVSINIDSAGNMHMIVENNVQGWLVNSPNDNMDREHPGIVPKPENPAPSAPSLVPVVSEALHALGSLDLNDGRLTTGTSAYDFSTVVVFGGERLFLNPAEYTNDSL